MAIEERTEVSPRKNKRIPFRKMTTRQRPEIPRCCRINTKKRQENTWGKREEKNKVISELKGQRIANKE